MAIDPPAPIHQLVEVVVRVAYRRVGDAPHRAADRRTAESVLLALADAQLDRVAEHGFDPAAAAALDTLRQHLVGGDDALGVTATILRLDHQGHWACRLDAPLPHAVACDLAAVAGRFRGDRRFAAIAIEIAPWRGDEPSPPPRPDTTLGDRVLLLDREPGGIDDLRDTARVCAALRNAIMRRCPVQPVPEWIGGHRRDGEALDRDHLAFIALPHLCPGGEWRLAAAALLVPREVSADAVAAELLPALSTHPVDGALRLWDAERPPLGWRLQPRRGGASDETLREAWWRGGTRGSARWASITPVVMDRHGSRPRERREAIERSCVRLGLPRPVEIESGPVSALPGVPVAGAFPMSRRADRHPRQQWHVRLAFDRPVRGPIVLGAGRYRGYGLMVPIGQGDGGASGDAE